MIEPIFYRLDSLERHRGVHEAKKKPQALYRILSLEHDHQP